MPRVSGSVLRLGTVPAGAARRRVRVLVRSLSGAARDHGMDVTDA